MITILLWILYGLIGVALWPWFARATLDWGAPFNRDGEDYVIAGVLSLIGAAVWPLVFVVAGLAWVIKHQLRHYLFGRS